MKEARTNLGIIGFGQFGKLFAKILVEDFSVFVYDKNKSEEVIINEAETIGIEVTPSNLSEVSSCKIVVFCVPILNFSEALHGSLKYFSRDTTIIDVLSVKKYPSEMIKSIVPKGIKVLLTHPMFGPHSAKKFKDLPIVICPEQSSQDVFTYWRNYFKEKGFRVAEMSCEEHDKITAKSLCVTQLLGRVLDRLGIVSSKEYGFDIDTEVFKNVLEMRKITCDDSWELFQGLQQKNPFAKKMREELIEALMDIENSINEKNFK